MPNLSQRERLAYAAGIFDGEGSMATYIGSGKYRRALAFHCSVWQSHPKLLHWFKDNFGGGVYIKTDKNQQRYEWRASSTKAYEFLCAILPYLVVRKKDVECMIEIWQHRFNRPRLTFLIAKRRKELDKRNPAMAEWIRKRRNAV